MPLNRSTTTLLTLVLCMFLNTGIAGPGNKASTDELAANKSIVDKLIHAFNGRDFAAVERLVANDFIKHGMPGTGPSVVVQTIQYLSHSFPDMQIKSNMMLAEADKVVVHITGTGRHENPFLGVPSKGREIQLNSIDIFRIHKGQIAEQWMVADRLGMMQQMTASFPESGPGLQLPVEKIAEFAAPAFLESLALAPDGSLLVSNMTDSTIYEIQADGTRRAFFQAELEPGPGIKGLVCLVPAVNGRMFATVISSDPDKHGVWMITTDGKGKPFATLPVGSMPNGITRHPDGNLLVADSAMGIIWKINSATAHVSQWFSHPLISPRQYLGQFPGANGIQINKHFVYVANSDKGNMIRIPILADGNAGVPEVAVEDLGGDDFAVSADGTLYVTTHPFNTVVRVLPDGERHTIAAADQGVVGPTAAILVNDVKGKYLYIATDGGLFTHPMKKPVALTNQTPGVYRVRLPD